MSEINAEVALRMLVERIRDEGKIVGRFSWEEDGMCGSGCSFIYGYWGFYWSDWESDVMSGPYQTIEEAFVDDFGSCGEVEYDVTVKALKASVIAGLIRIFAPPGHKITINGECWVVGSDEKLTRCNKCFPRLAGVTDMPVAEKVEGIAAGVAEGHIGHRRLWGGADVQLAAVAPEFRTSEGFYPPPRYVVTPFARELSWLFESLQIAFAGALDYLSKYEFYGRLADAADRYTAGTSKGSSEGLVSAVLVEARLLAEEFGDPGPTVFSPEKSP